MTQPCYDQIELKDYLSGKLQADCYDDIDQHLTQCERCLNTLASLDSAVESNLAELREPIVGESWETEAACLDTVRKIKQESIAALSGRRDSTPQDFSKFPAQIRDYEIVGVLGAGGMGTVYDATHTKLQRRVALKVLASRRTNDPESIRRFEREMQLVGTLQNCHVVAAVDAGEFDGTHYLVMERVDGVDLGNVLKRVGQLSIADACEIVRQTAIGLSYIHEHDMVHRDVKPSNLMLAIEHGLPIIKILDLGLARLQQHDGVAELTAADQLMGTLDYMAPEQTEASRQVDARADIYALGATLFKMLCGRAPFETERHDTSVKKLRALDSERPDSVRSIRAEVPKKLSQLIERMLSKSPAKRPLSAAEVADRLKSFARGNQLATLLQRAQAHEPIDHIADTSQTSAKPTRKLLYVGSARRERKPRSHRSLLAATGVVALAILLATAAVIFLQTPSQGIVRIEINDPNMVVTIGEESYTIANSGEEISIAPGETNLTIRRGELEFETTTFRIGKGTNPDLLVEYYNQEALVKFAGELRRLESTDLPHKSIAEPVAETNLATLAQRREAAERLLKLKAGLTVRSATGEFKVSTAEQLPQDSFDVIKVTMRQGDVFTEQCGKDLSTFINLEYLYFWPRTAELGALDPLSQLPNLKHLEIWGSGVRGEQLRFLQECTALRHITLEGGIDDSKLVYLKNATQLETLRIYRADVTGVGMSRLVHLDRLTTVDLNRTKLTDEGAIQIARLPALEHFWAIDTELTDKGLEAFRNHSTIRRFVVQETLVTDACFEHLKDLDLSEFFATNTAITYVAAEAFHKTKPNCKVVVGPNYARRILRSQDDAAQAAAANELHVAQWILANGGEVNRSREILLDPSGTFSLQRAFLHNMTDELFASQATRLQACENIHEFTIAGRHLTAKSLPAIAKIDTDELKISDLTATAEEFAVLRELPGRTQVTLVHSTSGHDFIEGVAGMPGLTFFGLQGCNIVDDESLIPLTRSKSINSIYLGSPELTSNGVEILSRISNLQSLRLVSHSLDDSMWQHFINLPRLTQLIVNAEGGQNRDRLRGSGIDALAAHKTLASLAIQHCNLSEDGIRSLGKLKQLEHLEFHEVQIEDRHLPHLYQLLNLNSIGLSNTNVTDVGVAALQEALPNCKIVRSPD